MAVDLEQFHQIFIEESVEGLDAMETALMELNIEEIDNEVINTIFRSAHSIKGGAGTFGFTCLASFTHVLETLLDDVRAGKRGLNTDEVNLLLQSVDCMRDMLGLIQTQRNEYTQAATEVKKELEAALSGKSNKKIKGEPSAEEVDPSAKQKSDAVWHISFKPNSDIIRTGNDPLRILRELQSISDTFESACIGEIPKLSNFPSEDCIFGWDIVLTAETLSQADIEEVFEWVIDECELTIARKEKNTINGINNYWKVHFSPDQSLLQKGNDPLKIFKDLSAKALFDQCIVNIENIPSLKSADCEKCYLSWDLVLSGQLSKKDIEEAFEWVSEESNIVIHQVGVDQLGEYKTASGLDQFSSDSSAKLIYKSEVLAPEKSEKLPQKASLHSIAKSDDANRLRSTDNSDTALDKSDASMNQSATKVQKKTANAESTSIRVGIDKIDSLINMVGELVITQSMLGQLGADFEMESLPKLIEGLSQLEQNTRELQESVMRIRMLPISFAFSRFPRMVRDLGQKLGKKINLILQGESTELDKTVMEKIGDPLVHLVRNSIDHGIETSDVRIRSGKSETGTVTLNAYHQGGNVIIEIIDDGRGLDREIIGKKGIERGLISETDALNFSDEQIFDLIFQPGFSTAAQVSDLSGRGVGMDVVKKNIQALSGIVEIQSQKGKGTKIRISLPLTLAILDGQLVKVGQDTYIFPLVSIVESMRYKEESVNHIAGGCRVFKLREEYVPIVDLSESFGGLRIKDYANALMVVVECDNYKVAMLVDELMAQQQVVIKSLEQNYQRVEGISGATILGDGTVALIIDVPGVVRLAGDTTAHKHVLPQSA